MKRFELNLDDLSDAIIYPYYHCNLSCRQCSVSRPSKEEIGFLKVNPQALEPHITRSMLERMLTWRVDNWIILGGEPFLSKGFIDILKILGQDQGRVIVYTNSVLIYEHLQKHGYSSQLEEVMSYIDRLIVSLEGGREFTDYWRGKGVYDKACYVIEKLKDEGYDVAVRMGYYDENLMSVLEEAKRLNERDVPVLLFPRLDKPPLSMEVTYSLYTIVATMDKTDILLPSYKNFIGVSKEGVGCPAGWAKICVLPDGYLTPCQWNSVAVAHLDWDDEMIESAFTQWCQSFFKVRDRCWTCKYAMTCRGSCRMCRDYLTCPLAKGYELVDRGYVDFFGEKVEVNRSKIIAEVKKEERMILHGCSAGC